VIVALLGIGSSALATANTSRKLPPPYDPSTDDRGESTLMTILIVLVIVVLALFLFGAIR